MNPQILEKLKKILRLATGNSNPHEAEVALKKAQQIAIENQIDIASINIDGENKAQESYEKGEVSEGARFSVCQRFVNLIIQKHFNVSVITSGGRQFGRKIHFIGKVSDVDFAKWINEYLNEVFMRAWYNHKQIYDAPTRLRESFIFGCYKGLSAKLEANKQEVEANKFKQIAEIDGQEKSQEIQKSYALVIIGEKEQMDKAVAKFFPKLKSGPAHTVKMRDLSTIQAGYEKGQKININRPLAHG